MVYWQARRFGETTPIYDPADRSYLSREFPDDRELIALLCDADYMRKLSWSAMGAYEYYGMTQYVIDPITLGGIQWDRITTVCKSPMEYGHNRTPEKTKQKSKTN